MSLPGGKQCKETLLRKASESAAHVAGFGLHLEGYGPPNLPEGFFDSLLLPSFGGKHRLSKKPLCIVAKWLFVVGESRNMVKVATCGGRVS